MRPRRSAAYLASLFTLFVALMTLQIGCGDSQTVEAPDAGTTPAESEASGGSEDESTANQATTENRSQVASADDPLADVPEVTAVSFQPPSLQGYVGDKACVECHEALCDSYAAHPMARSIVPVDLEAEGERIDGEETLVGTPRHHYRVAIEDDTLVHTERMVDAAGETVFEQGEQIDYIIGSGQRAFAYMAERDNLLLMSPLNYYTPSATYDFSPTHTLDDQRRFSRRVSDDCLSCHAGRVNVLQRNSNRYDSPVFSHAAIGCENCHGPGESHIQFQAGELAAADEPPLDPIVNPAKLDHEQREAICYQCHLHAPARLLRPGRSQFDFRPGDRLEDIWAMMVSDTGIGEDGTTKAVSHVMQMHASACFQGSPGAMGCISCHDPHGIPSPDNERDFYRSRCLQCHQDDSCTAPIAHRQTKDDSCYRCHMPAREAQQISHISQTDHRVIVPRESTQPTQATVADDSAHGHALEFFWNIESRLPDWEKWRSRGMGLWLVGSHSGRPNFSVIENLAPLAEQDIKDGPLLTVLGAFWNQAQSLDRARFFFEQALEDPNVWETCQSNLLTIYYLSGRHEDALKCAEAMLTIDPENARALALQADLLVLTGEEERGLESAEQALRFNPTLAPVRQWLIKRYRMANREEDAQRHKTLLEKIQAAAVAKP